MLTPYQHRQLQRLRWTAFIVVGLAFVLSFFHRFAPAAIASDLKAAFDIQSAALGGLAATYFYVDTVMQIPTGVLADTLGPRRIVVAGGVVAGLGSILFGLAPSFELAAAGRLLVGLGVSVTFIAILKLNAAWFSEGKFGTLTGLTILLGNLGAVLAASPLAWVLAYASWRDAFVVTGLLSLFLAWLAWWLVRDNPGQMGLPSLRELEGKAAHPAHEGHWYDGLVQVAGNHLTWPGFFVNLGISGTLFAFAGLWAVPWLEHTYGYTRVVAAQHTSLLMLGVAFGAVAIGVISDRLGNRLDVMRFTAFAQAASWLPWVVRADWPQAATLAWFFAMGLVIPGFTLSWTIAKESNRPEHSGIATSVVNTGIFLGTGILQPLVGWVVDRSKSAGDLAGAWSSGIVVLALAATLGAFATLAIARPHR